VVFDPKRATEAIAFTETFLRHADGRPFQLAPFQQFMTGAIFGWRSGAVRRFRHVWLEAAKGGGKSPWAASVALTALFLDAERGSELFCAAVTREQARIQFRDCATMAQASPTLAKRLEFADGNIAMPETGSFIRPISSEARALDGKRVSVGLIDEVMEHASADVYDKLRAGTKARLQPLIVCTSNSGYDKNGIAWRLHEYSIRVLEGVEQNDTWFGLIFALDPCAACRAAGHQQPNGECPDCDQIEDESRWLKSNRCRASTCANRWRRRGRCRASAAWWSGSTSACGRAPACAGCPRIPGRRVAPLRWIARRCVAGPACSGWISVSRTITRR
jgi:phage terminase large subunit-like protein